MGSTTFKKCYIFGGNLDMIVSPYIFIIIGPWSKSVRHFHSYIIWQNYDYTNTFFFFFLP